MASKGNVGTLSFGVNLNLKKFKRKLDEMMKTVSDVGTKFAAFGTASAAGIGAATIAIGESAKEVTNWADRLGMARQEFAALAKVGEKFGADTDAVGDSIKDLNERIADASTGNKTYEEALNKIGLSYKDLVGLSPQEQFLKTADAIGKLNDKGMQNFVTAELMGDAGFRLLPMFRQGEEAIRGMTAAVIENNEVMNPQQAAQIEVMWQNVNKSVSQTKGFFEALAAEFAPIITLASDLYNEFLKAFGGDVIGGVKSFTDGVLELAKTHLPYLISSVWAIWDSVKVVFNQIGEALGVLGINFGNTAGGFADNMTDAFLWVAKFFGSFSQRLTLGFIKLGDFILNALTLPFQLAGNAAFFFYNALADIMKNVAKWLSKFDNKFANFGKEVAETMAEGAETIAGALNKGLQFAEGGIISNTFKGEVDALNAEIDENNKKIEDKFAQRSAGIKTIVDGAIQGAKDRTAEIVQQQKELATSTVKNAQAASEVIKKAFTPSAIAGSVDALKLQFGGDNKVQNDQLKALKAIERNTKLETYRGI